MGPAPPRLRIRSCQCLFFSGGPALVIRCERGAAYHLPVVEPSSDLVVEGTLLFAGVPQRGSDLFVRLLFGSHTQTCRIRKTLSSGVLRVLPVSLGHHRLVFLSKSKGHFGDDFDNSELLVALRVGCAPDGTGNSLVRRDLSGNVALSVDSILHSVADSRGCS